MPVTKLLKRRSSPISGMKIRKFVGKFQKIEVITKKALCRNLARNETLGSTKFRNFLLKGFWKKYPRKFWFPSEKSPFQTMPGNSMFDLMCPRFEKYQKDYDFEIY